jgi:hypothetical protein
VVATLLVTALVTLGVPAAGLPDTDDPELDLARKIRTTPFVGSSTSMRDGEGSAYVPRDDSLWLADDNSNQVFEVNRRTGALKSVISAGAFNAAPRVGGSEPAGSSRAGDLESMAYSPSTDTLYAFSGPCCSSSAKPTAFRLKRSNGRFRVESHQRLPAGTNLTAAAVRPSDGRLYVSSGGSLRTYNYASNALGSTFSISGLSGILGLGFSTNGADLFAVTSSERLRRVNWATRKFVSGWTFELDEFDVEDSRAVELVGNQFFVLDGTDGSPSVFVFDIED